MNGTTATLSMRWPWARGEPTHSRPLLRSVATLLLACVPTHNQLRRNRTRPVPHLSFHSSRRRCRASDCEPAASDQRTRPPLPPPPWPTCRRNAATPFGMFAMTTPRPIGRHDLPASRSTTPSASANHRCALLMAASLYFYASEPPHPLLLPPPPHCRCAFGYSGKTTITLHGTGTGGHEELMTMCTPDVVLYCLLRLLQGDRESQRVKFVFIVFTGENVGGMTRGRVGVHVGSVKPLVGVRDKPLVSPACLFMCPCIPPSSPIRSFFRLTAYSPRCCGLTGGLWRAAAMQLRCQRGQPQGVQPAADHQEAQGGWRRRLRHRVQRRGLPD